MGAYLDSAIIAKLYFREATSPDAIALVSQHDAPYLLTHWQALEVRNAIRLESFRGEISMAEMDASLGAFEEDIATGRWRMPAYERSIVEQKAEALSRRHTAGLGCRTLDIIHVAVAMVLGATPFVTFDLRQKKLAAICGLAVEP